MGEKEKKLYLVVDGKEQQLDYEKVRMVKFSPNGDDMIFVGYKNKLNYIVRNGKQEGTGYYSISDIQYYPNGKGIAVVITQEDGIEYVIRNGIKDKTYNGLRNLKFSRFGELYYRAFQNGKEIMVKDGVEINEGQINDFTISPDGKTTSYQMLKDLSQFNKDRGYSAIDKFTFSPDGTSNAYIVVKGDKGILIKDGQELNLGEFTYSPDGTYFIHSIYENGKDIIIENGIKSKTTFYSVYKLFYSPDGNNIIIVDNHIGRGYTIDVLTRKNKTPLKNIIFTDPEDLKYVLSPNDEELISHYNESIKNYLSKYTSNGLGDKKNLLVTKLKAKQGTDSNSRKYLIFQALIDYVNNYNSDSLFDDHI